MNCEVGTMLKKFPAHFMVMYMHMNDEPEEIPKNLSMAHLKIRSEL
jgi:hypothetical protein